MFPTLRRLALDLFSCLAMSAKCERVFSRAKQLITDERNRLTASTIQANELQKDWLRKKLVKSWLKKGDREELRKLAAELETPLLHQEEEAINVENEEVELATSQGSAD